jgi:hypothetical protein
VLLGEGEPDDPDGTEGGKEHVRGRDPDSPEQNPDDIHDRGQGPGGPRGATDLFAEGDQRKKRNLEALDPKRDANDRQTKNQAAEKILQEENKSPSQNDPQDIAK